MRQTLASFATVIWFGLLAGLVDLALIITRVQIAQHGLFRKSPHLLWMVPVASVAMFGVAGIVLMLIARLIPKARGMPFLCALCVLGVFAVALAIPGLKATACLMLALGLGAWIAPWLARHRMAFEGFVWKTLPLLGLVVIGLGGWTFGREWLAEHAAVSQRPPAPAGAPNVLFIVMDTVRADATSLHRADRDTTPNLERMARRGVRFDRAIASASWTLPSHVSMFTGLWPSQLRVGLDRPLGADPPTLAEYLASRGYASAGFIANTVFCSREYGLSRGFEHYEDYVISASEVLRSSSLGWLTAKVVRRVLDRMLPLLGCDPRHPFEADVLRKNAAQINRQALRWIDRQAGRPFFVFLNYMDAHDPYLLPPGVEGRYGGTPTTPAEFDLLKRWPDIDKTQSTPAELALARNAYDENVAYLDDQLGRLFAALEERGMLENTILVVTSDHGEHFGEHEREGTPLYTHGMSLYQAEIHVPLLIVAPGRVVAGARVTQPVSLRDLPATLVELAGLAQNAPFPGVSMSTAWQPGEEGFDLELSLLSESALLSKGSPNVRYRVAAPGLMRAVVSRDMVYHRIGVDQEELYDLSNDPGELNNLVENDALQDQLQALRETMDRLVEPSL